MKQDDVARPGGSDLSEVLGLGAMLPACWTLTETLDANETTTAGYLWFKNPQNTAWEPLYRRVALTRVLENAKATQQHNAELLEEVERLRMDLENTRAEAVLAVATERERCAKEIAMLRRLVLNYEQQAHRSVNDLEFGA